jgi:hypothetical protein
MEMKTGKWNLNTKLESQLIKLNLLQNKLVNLYKEY